MLMLCQPKRLKNHVQHRLQRKKTCRPKLVKKFNPSVLEPHKPKLPLITLLNLRTVQTEDDKKSAGNNFHCPADLLCRNLKVLCERRRLRPTRTCMPKVLNSCWLTKLLSQLKKPSWTLKLPYRRQTMQLLRRRHLKPVSVLKQRQKRLPRLKMVVVKRKLFCRKQVQLVKLLKLVKQLNKPLNELLHE